MLIRAHCPLIYLVSSEEKRVDLILASAVEKEGKPLFSWSVTRGLRQVAQGTEGPAVDGSEDPVAALQAIGKLPGPCVVVLKDFHSHLTTPRVVRALRELGHGLRAASTSCVLLSPTLVMPVELEKDVNVLDVPLPTFRDLGNLLREMVGVLRQSNKVQVDLKREQVEEMVKAALGLTHQEAENAFAKAIAQDQKIDANDIKLVLDEKRQVIRKSGLLEYYPAEESLASVGGLQNLKIWLTQRSTAFSEAARSFGLPEPKGLLLLGVQGCGKTLTAKAIASQWGLPLLRLDMGRIFSGSLGSSEENLRRAIRVAESAAPAVLWIDEIDKGLSGLSGSGDGGTSARVFGAMLTWLQDKTAPLFVVATANRIEALPPELLRKGRFDEIFFVDLPDARERTEILAIHLARRGRDPARFELGQLGAFTEGFSGAEIEQVIVSALYQAFAQHTELSQEHLVQALRETFPLSKTLREEIQRLRRWALDRTRPASLAQPHT
jgi:SpoVK/Ycf46/Vps4 family AAA+-type ATPase